MTEQITGANNRRGQVVAGVGFIIQLLAGLLLLVLALKSDESPEQTKIQSLYDGAIFILAGLPIWVALLFTYGLRRRADLKEREVEELERARQSDPNLALFQMEEVTVERRRLEWTHKWVFPVLTVLMSLFLIGRGIWGQWTLGTQKLDDPIWTYKVQVGLLLAMVAGLGFFLFVYSRYAAGMSRQPVWRLLRGGASYMVGGAMVCMGLVLSIVLHTYEVSYGEPVVAYAIRILMILLGVENLLSLLLNFYRPRVRGQEHRPGFDSRLLEIISDPGQVARSIAEAINYQFGFEVTSTWFAQLIRRAFFPLVMLGVVVLLALSSVVVVDVSEEAYIKRFGKLVQDRSEPLEAGLHFKYPWPIDSVYRYPVNTYSMFVVGTKPKENERDEQGNLKPILWTEKHEFAFDVMIVVAMPEDTMGTRSATESSTPGSSERARVNMMYVSMPVEYRVKDLYDWLYTFDKPEAVMESFAFQMLTQYAAGIPISELMGPGRDKVSRTLKGMLQEKMDEINLGAEITFLGIQQAHPPDANEVAKAFQNVINAQISKQGDIEGAHGAANVLLTETAGSVQRATELDNAIQEMDRLVKDNSADAEAKEQTRLRVDNLLRVDVADDVPLGGTAAKLISEAQADKTDEISLAESKYSVFEAEVTAWKAAPSLYRYRKYLDMLEKSLKDIRKWVLTSEQTDVILIMESNKDSAIDIDSMLNQK